MVSWHIGHVCRSAWRFSVRPFLNPEFTGPVILGKPDHSFNPRAFLAPPPTLVFMAISEETP